MPHKAHKWLYDALKAIEELTIISKAFNGDFHRYKTNLTGKRAVEREFEIIGEAINKALKEKPDLAITDAKKIVALRNYIIHSYDNVQDEMIWSVLINHLPKLEREIRLLLNN